MTTPNSLRYSTRLPWDLPENPLFVIRQERTAQGREVLDLTGSNPTSCGLGDWNEAIAKALAQPGSAHYHPVPQGSAEARAAVAAYYSSLGWNADPEDLLLTASTSESYSMLFQLFCDPGDEVLVPRPSYPLFQHLGGLAGVGLQPYLLQFAGEWQVDFPSLEAAVGDRTRALVVVNPNNPTGSYLRPPEAQRLLELCAERGMALIADEVFWEYSLRDHQHLTTPGITSPERAWFAAAESPALCVSMGGLSKSAGMPQMKLGWMLVRGPEQEKVRVMARLRWIADTYLSVSAPVQEALPALLGIGAEIRASIQQRVRLNLGAIATWQRNTPSVSLLPAEGGWSAVLRLPSVVDDEQWCERFLREVGVWVQPGYYYDLAGGAYVVLSLLSPPGALVEGLARIAPIVTDAAR
ncbi:MAG: pyridoxal phosphate-dependent aminotransferase [Bryobacterales bacterium]|nr:pyridoxal phosphate-dependent aminotransferase [Bryobacterales bacterium]